MNAGVIAKERGISYSEIHSSDAHGYANIVEANISGTAGEFLVRGTHVDAYGPRIVRINEFNVDLFPSGHLLYIRHNDQPGVIGEMGQLIGEHGLNIATMQVGRKEEGGDAIMMLSVDKEVPDAALRDLLSIDAILAADLIEL